VVRDAGIIVIGDEVLSGFTRDINIYTLSSKLRDLGVECTIFMGVRDREEDIKKAIDYITAGWDPKYIITTGGLGITHDDITVEAISKALNLRLRESSEARKFVLEAMQRLKETITDEDSLKKLYMLPEGFSPLRNPVGVAPGLIGEVVLGGRRRTIIVLPGVPAEAEGIFVTNIAGRIMKQPEGVERVYREIAVRSRESKIHRVLKTLQKEFEGLKVGSYPQTPEVVLIRLSGSKEEVERGFKRLVDLLQEVVGPAGKG